MLLLFQMVLAFNLTAHLIFELGYSKGFEGSLVMGSRFSVYSGLQHGQWQVAELPESPS